MEELKSYTDIEQSKKLAKILPIESADMYYECTEKEQEYKIYVGRNAAIIYNLFSYRNGNVIPCWSLVALFSILPKTVDHETLFIETSPALWHIGYRNVYTARTDNPIDTCYELVLKLNKLNLL